VPAVAFAALGVPVEPVIVEFTGAAVAALPALRQQFFGHEVLLEERVEVRHP
jgi:hypothetical protein